MKIAYRGDTLIEVLFAFAILATIVGFSFTGALANYKTALAAQNRTQATFVAQYQADGLKTYRDSIDWDSSNGLPSFLGGNASPKLEKITDLIPNTSFCMGTVTQPNGIKFWVVQKTNCGSIAQALAPNLDQPDVSIKIADDSSATPNPNRKIATVIVSWQPRNSSIREQVTNTLLLTKEQ